MNRIIPCVTALLAIAFTGTAGAHTLILDCYTVTGRVVACQTSYSDGTNAPGVDITLYTDADERLGSSKTDEHGVYLFKAPPDEYVVVVGVGPAHVASLASPDISTKPQRPGWNGNWVPVVAVDRLDKLQQWQDQFLSERPPLIEKIEKELTNNKGAER